MCTSFREEQLRGLKCSGYDLLARSDVRKRLVEASIAALEPGGSKMHSFVCGDERCLSIKGATPHLCDLGSRSISRAYILDGNETQEYPRRGISQLE